MGEQAAHKYGANLTNKQFAVLVIAIALGTLLEWFDFFVFAQLNAYITKAFFPSSDPTVQQISFWGLYASGFIARPFGSVLFGHIGDTKGRRLTLLISVTMMAIPTMLIGCLPTFAQAGIAAPILLAVLRIIQGLAMGGEFGAAMVYLHEIAPADKKGVTGSIGFASAMLGCTLGVLVVVILEAIFSPAQMQLFGWRLPFLMTIVSASAAFVLRMHMPEPHEFTEDRQTVIQHNLVRIASQRASSLSRSGSANHSRNFSNLGSFKLSGSFKDYGAGGDVEKGCVHGDKLHTFNSKELQPTIKEGESVHDSPAKGAAAVGSDAAVSIEGIPEKQGDYIPIVRLLRKHNVGLLLQFIFEAWVSIGFYVTTTWLPVQLKKAPVNMPEIITQVMLIINLVIMGLVQLTAGWASDKGVPRLWSCFGVYLVAAGISVPVFIGFGTASIAGSWLMHTLLMVLMGWVLGVVPAACSSIYPASVRATGFNLGHNMAMSWLGGVSPTIVTALVAATGSLWLSPGILLSVAAVFSMLAAVALIRVAPAANKTPVSQ